MFEVQQYNQVFEITFPVEIAQQVLGVMESLYGSEFDRVHGKTDADVLIEKMREVLDGITPQQLQKGLELMKSEKWCPTLPGFRLLCLQDHDWWSAEMAWAKALNFQKGDGQEITALTKRALDEVKQVISVEGQKSARKAFFDIYTDYLAKAQMLGIRQEWHVPPVMITTASVASTQSNTQLPEQSTGEKALVDSRIKELLADGKTLPEAMLGAMQEIRNQRAGGTA